MGRLPAGPTTLRDVLREQRRAQRQLSNRSPFTLSAASVVSDGAVQSTDFDGDLGTRDAGSVGWALGPMSAAFGDLILRPGSIGNDALLDPVEPAVIWQQVTGFTVSPTWSTVIVTSATVPAGCTRLMARATSRVTAFLNNVGVGVDYLYSLTWIGAVNSNTYPLAVTDNGGSGTNTTSRDALLTGLTPGGTVTISTQASTDYNTWTGTSFNVAQLGATLLWLR